MTDKNDPFVQEILRQLYEDDLDAGRPIVPARTEMSPTGFLHVVHEDPVFPIAVAVHDLEWAAKSVDKGQRLLARPGVPDVVRAVRELLPQSVVTLTHQMERTLAQFDINGHEIAARIEQDRTRKHNGLSAPKIRGYFEKAPKDVVGTGLGRVFTVQGGENEFSLMGNEGFAYFRRVLELVQNLRPAPKMAKKYAQRAVP